METATSVCCCFSNICCHHRLSRSPEQPVRVEWCHCWARSARSEGSHRPRSSHYPHNTSQRPLVLPDPKCHTKLTAPTPDLETAFCADNAFRNDRDAWTYHMRLRLAVMPLRGSAIGAIGRCVPQVRRKRALRGSHVVVFFLFYECVDLFVCGAQCQFKRGSGEVLCELHGGVNVPTASSGASLV